MTTHHTQDYIQWFRRAAPYINTHRGKIFVLWLGGECIVHENFANIVHDINLLHSLGIRLVLVHGTRSQIDQALPNSKFHQGLRISTFEDMDTICRETALVRYQIESMFSLGIANSPMQNAAITISSGNYVSAKPLGVIDGVDYEHTGTVRNINSKAIISLLDTKQIVLLSNIAYSGTGEIFNLMSEQVAKQAAIALGADKLIYFTSSEGCLDKQGKLLRELSSANSTLDVQEAQQPLFRYCSEACEHGVNRAHVINYENDGALIKELFTTDGSGTLISKQPYENLRPAVLNDVGGILELIEPLELQGVLVKRSREILENEIDCFTVIERDGRIIACAALYLYPEKSLGELACICVSKDYQNEDRGEKLLAFVEKQANILKLEKIFVLTTQASHWFLERGFTKASIDDLPLKKQTLYNFQRNSLIFLKSIT